MKKFIKKHEIWIFLVLAPLLNTLFVYIRTQDLLPSFVYTHGRFWLLLLLLIVIVKFTKGIKGIKDVFRPMLKWNIHLKWYFFSLLFALTISSIVLLLKAFYYGGELFEFFKLDFSGISLKTTFFLLIWAFVGEVVWVSYSVRELIKTMKPLYASQIVGFFWSLWWLPVVYLNEGVVLDLPVWPLFIGMLGTAGMCAFVYQHTKSGLCVLVLQFMLNMSLIVFPVSPKGGGVPTYIAFVTVYFIVMLGLMYFVNPNKIVKEKI